MKVTDVTVRAAHNRLRESHGRKATNQKRRRNRKMNKGRSQRTLK